VEKTRNSKNNIRYLHSYQMDSSHQIHKGST